MGSSIAASSVRVSQIREDADFGGVRGQFHATVAKTRMHMRVDIGFGDVITPAPAEVDYPTLLNFSGPILRSRRLPHRAPG